ncbi:MAG TPA: hypothetical protein PK544_14095 [Spirochaetota bacterium]|nr:hypothetical protein [Spirochaetota bacterium]HPJ38526.1 hypothetical protein [Spirochaetota bacterium]HPQ53735.1 hypothetical protein [Spirochaetota bacterium]
MKERCKSFSYSVFNFDSLVHPKRFSGKSLCDSNIDYDTAVVDYDFNFIVPGDTIMRIVAFDWVPVQYRTLRLGVNVESAGSHEQKKRIDFDFHRNEYRAKGSHFRKPEKANDVNGAGK